MSDRRDSAHPLAKDASFTALFLSHWVTLTGLLTSQASNVVHIDGHDLTLAGVVAVAR